MRVIKVFLSYIILNISGVDTLKHPKSHNVTQPLDYLIINHILNGYDRKAIPRSYDEPLLVHIGFTLTQLHSLDEKSQMLRSSGWFDLVWKDYRLEWNETVFNKSSIVVPSRELWLPDIGFLNSVSLYHSSMIKDEFRCEVRSDGSVLWTPGGTYQTTCELDISNFPFDNQTCFIHLTNWAYNSQEMNMTNSSSLITMDSYEASAEWDITQTLVFREAIVYECCGNVSYPSVLFYIWIERKSLYYVVNMISPCVILSALATFIFCVPPDSGEKVSLGITLLLSFTVFQLIVAENIPRRSDSVPVISQYISMITASVGGSVVCSILISNLHHQSIPMPRCLAVITFGILAKFVSIKSLKRVFIRNPVFCKNESENELRTSRVPLSRTSFKNESESECKALLALGLNGLNGTTARHRQSDHNLKAINAQLDYIIQCIVKYRSREDNSISVEGLSDEETWHAAARVYDRLFFVIMLLTVLSVSCKLILAASHSF